jgi:two-component sensor histidine kinase
VRVGHVSKTLLERTELPAEAIAVLSSLTSNWSLLADFALSDLILWVPTWNEGGMVAVAQIRPATAPTTLAEDVVGSFAPRGRFHYLDQAEVLGRATINRDIAAPLSPVGVEAIPVKLGEQVIGVIARHASEAPRVAGQLEQVYLESADAIFAMIAGGQAWLPESLDEFDRWEMPRAGDGLLRLDATGKVNFASPNAVSSFRKMGLALDLVGQQFFEIVKRMSVAPAGMSAPLVKVARGGASTMADLDGDGATLMLASHFLCPPPTTSGLETGAECTVIVIKDVTDVREHQRELLSKDAIIKEINHRVKNNLQMVTSVLRLQSRRASDPGVVEALRDAQSRIGIIAAIHDSLSLEGATSIDFDVLVESLLGLIHDDSVDLETAMQGSIGTVNSRIATPMAMAVSELIHNSVKHARGTEILVQAKREVGALTVSVSDNGIGATDSPMTSSMPLSEFPNCGLGLTIVSDLIVGELNGQVRIEPTSFIDGLGRGTSVRITVPLARRDSPGA